MVTRKQEQDAKQTRDKSNPVAKKKGAAGKKTKDAPKGAAGKRKIDFPIVGLGASAGGLEALEAFFSNMPYDSNIAFVVANGGPKNGLKKSSRQKIMFEKANGLKASLLEVRVL